MSGKGSVSSHWEDSIEAEKAGASLADAPEPDPWTHLEPLFPVTSFTPLSECPHRGPIAEGSSFVCMVCNQSGKDGYRALPRDVRPLPVDPPPEPEPPEDGKATPTIMPFAPSGLKGGIG